MDIGLSAWASGNNNESNAYYMSGYDKGFSVGVKDGRIAYSNGEPPIKSGKRPHQVGVQVPYVSDTEEMKLWETYFEGGYLDGFLSVYAPYRPKYASLKRMMADVSRSDPAFSASDVNRMIPGASAKNVSDLLSQQSTIEYPGASSAASIGPDMLDVSRDMLDVSIQEEAEDDKDSFPTLAVLAVATLAGLGIWAMMGRKSK